ncbi:putative nuclease HARBI1 [Salvia splendens]|uniref:putative nuclease HARBI1 n=1 Tax=Salvia splendens TaxID=180675 RepID=UPI001C258BAC|nr:putative nuclease HARBI1 [Salvia splendens]XP_042023261.1 putative nuclease HARBI1 [Salvia splendens]
MPSYDCLGLLDGTYINVLVSNEDKPRYRTRKGHIATNTLAVCDTNLKFTYFLPGWEGSAADSRVLRDAINREDGLRVPRGNYYLCDGGYANSEGFLAPYKGVRYHLKEWGHENQRPQNARELFNMRHSRARNVIERAFGIMKMRWGILRSASYYPIKVQNRIIMACFLLHNFIRNEMEIDPIEEQIEIEMPHLDYEDDGGHADFVDIFESTVEWNQKRDEIAQAMWLNYNEGGM